MQCTGCYDLTGKFRKTLKKSTKTESFISRFRSSAFGCIGALALTSDTQLLTEERLLDDVDSNGLSLLRLTSSHSGSSVCSRTWDTSGNHESSIETNKTDWATNISWWMNWPDLMTEGDVWGIFLFSAMLMGENFEIFQQWESRGRHTVYTVVHLM